MSSVPLIALLSDFGEDDPFVGIMKGVIAGIAPQAQVVDITHKIPPGDTHRAAVMIWQSAPYFPSGTVFLSVVDPGVGTLRRGVIVQTDDHVFVGPDNGLFTFILKDEGYAWELADPKYQLPQPGATFHGRDIFAPAAAHAAIGIQGSQFGYRIPSPVQLGLPRLQLSTGQIQGEVLYSDRFGNLLTSLGKLVTADRITYHLDPWLDLGASDYGELPIESNQAYLSIPDGSRLSWVDTFADIPGGNCAMLVGSSGLIEIAANRKRAADLLKLDRGDHITLYF